MHGTVEGVLVFLPDGTLRADIRPVITTYERLSPSSKHRKFVSERMRDKHVSSVAGIAHEYSDALVDLGFDKAYILFGQFLIYRKDRLAFIEWLVDTIGISVKNAMMAYDCLNEWSEKFL
ncbi:hypothetical protein Angca_010096 [Angiostrongylus cantonensis]|nr:hypothetical protein Angca_010096 [Angiostrongylus cantonensis]